MVVISHRRIKPRQRTVGPGGPSPRRPRWPPNRATARKASATVSSDAASGSLASEPLLGGAFRFFLPFFP